MTRPTPSWRRYLRFHADTRADVDDELAFHIELVTQTYVERGLSPDAARRRARDEFGDIERARSECYRIDDRQDRRRERGELLTAVGQDIHYAVRGLRAAPAFTAGVALMMGLAIFAIAAMFAVVDPLFVRRPAYLPNPAAVHRIYENSEGFMGDGPGPALSVARYRDLREFARAFSEFAVFSERDAVVTTDRGAAVERVVTASASLWRLFDAKPLFGRFSTDAEDETRPNTAIAVLGYDFWRSHFAGDANVVGQTLDIGGRAYRIIGIAPRGFVGLSSNSPAAWVPLLSSLNERVSGFQRSPMEQYNSHWLEMIGRRRRGWTIAAATADLDSALARSLAKQRSLGAVAGPGSPMAFDGELTGDIAPVLRQRGPFRSDQARVALWLAILAAVVLLVAVLNVANLVLARTLRRQQEIAVRIALGGTMARLVRLLLAESVILMGAGATLGIAALAWIGDTVRQWMLPHVDLPAIVVTPRVIFFTLAAATLAAVMIALAPAFHARRWNVRVAMAESARGGSLRRSWLRTIMLVTQGALSLALCVTAGLFIRSLINIRALPLGYEPRRVVVITPMAALLDRATGQSIAEAVAARLRARPNALDVAQSVSLPFSMAVRRAIRVAGADQTAIGDGVFLYNAVSPEYFRVVGTRILQGRGFTDADNSAAERVTVVSASMAERLWPHKPAIGQCLLLERDRDRCTRVVGVSEKTRLRSFQRDGMLDYYVPESQGISTVSTNTLVRVNGSAAAFVPLIERLLAGVAPSGVYLRVTTMQDPLDRAAAAWRVGSTMLSVFALLALVVSALGVYAAVNFDLVERRHEIGIRLALGATRRDLLRGAVSSGARVAIGGVIAGSVVALAIGAAVSKLLFHVSSRDPATFTVAGLVIVAAFLGASVLPAFRAARTDPALILRSG